jgi:hypothetical protein
MQHNSLIPEPTAEEAVQIIKEWKESPALRSEFKNFGSYSAFRRAELAGISHKR